MSFSRLLRVLCHRLDDAFIVSINRLCVTLSLRHKGGTAKRTASIKRKIFRETVLPTISTNPPSTPRMPDTLNTTSTQTLTLQPPVLQTPNEISQPESGSTHLDSILPCKLNDLAQKNLRLSHQIPGLTEKCPDILALSPYVEPYQPKSLRKVEILDYTQKKHILAKTTLKLIDFPTLPAHSTESTPLYNIDTWNNFDILAKDLVEAVPDTDDVSTNTALSSDFCTETTNCSDTATHGLTTESH